MPTIGLFMLLKDKFFASWRHFADFASRKLDLPGMPCINYCYGFFQVVLLYSLELSLTGRMPKNGKKLVRPGGGIGRRARLRGVWVTVRVQVPLRTIFKKRRPFGPPFL